MKDSQSLDFIDDIDEYIANYYLITKLFMKIFASKFSII